MEAYNPNGGMTPEKRAFMEQAMRQQKEQQEWADKVAAQMSSSPGMTLAKVPLMGLDENAKAFAPAKIAPLPTEGKISDGPADIYHRPFVKNDDGSVSTLLSGIYDDNNGYHVYAGIGADGTKYSDDEAMKRAINNGDNVIATFNNLNNASAYDKALHERQAKSLDYMNDPEELAKFQFRSEYADHPERFVDENTYKTAATEQPAAQSQTATTTPPPALQFPNNNDLAMRAATLKPMGDTERAFASQIVADKQAYDAAKAAGDEEGMAKAHAHAEGLRRAANAYGVDMYAFDRQFSKDNTLENAQAYTQMDYDKGVGDISNMLTPQEHYYKVLAEYKAQGMRDRPAREKALEEMERYEAEYQRKLGTAMTRYGVNDDGSMNRFGAQIADLIYLNNPQSLALYDRYYANPFQNWKFDKNMQVQDKLYNQKVDYGQHQFDWQSALIRNKGDVEKTLIEAKNAGALALQNNKLAFLASHPELAGGGRRGSNSGKPDKAESQLAMSLRNKTEQARQAIETSNPDREKSGDLLDDAIASNQKAYDEGKITEDVYSDFYGRLDALRRERDRAFGFKNT